VRRTHWSFLRHGAEGRGRKREIHAASISGSAHAIDTGDVRVRVVGAVVFAGGAAFRQMRQRGSFRRDDFLARPCGRIIEVS
jgi:hypothetical protein